MRQKDITTAQVVVGKRHELKTTAVKVKEVNWLGNLPFEKLPSDGITLKFKVRSTHPPKLGKLWNKGYGTAIIELYENEEGVAPGQACVFYDQKSTRVYGGGWICQMQ